MRKLLGLIIFIFLGTWPSGLLYGQMISVSNHFNAHVDALPSSFSGLKTEKYNDALDLKGGYGLPGKALNWPRHEYFVSFKEWKDENGTIDPHKTALHYRQKEDCKSDIYSVKSIVPNISLKEPYQIKFTSCGNDTMAISYRSQGKNDFQITEITYQGKNPDTLVQVYTHLKFDQDGVTAKELCWKQNMQEWITDHHLRSTQTQYAGCLIIDPEVCSLYLEQAGELGKLVTQCKDLDHKINAFFTQESSQTMLQALAHKEEQLLKTNFKIKKDKNASSESIYTAPAQTSGPSTLINEYRKAYLDELEYACSIEPWGYIADPDGKRKSAVKFARRWAVPDRQASSADEIKIEDRYSSDQYSQGRAIEIPAETHHGAGT